ISSIDLSDMPTKLNEVDITVACDVKNILVGKEGAAYIYGQQKGANQEQIELLDSYLDHFSKKISNDLGIDIKNIPGSGAAGGIGGTLYAFLNAKLEEGGKLILKLTQIKNELESADLVITGEGGMDYQT